MEDTNDRPNMSFSEFKFQCDSAILNRGHQRPGQAIINLLRTVWPQEYSRLSSLDYYERDDIDCFYVDALIPNTMRHLEFRWQEVCEHLQAKYNSDPSGNNDGFYSCDYCNIETKRKI